MTLFLLLFFEQVNNGSQRLTIYASPRGNQSQKYSRIDEPLYELENGALWEHFEFKSIRKSRELAKLYGNELKWAPNVPKNFFERRGNFENITLLAMTEAELSYNELPKDLKEVANVSELIPNTYEVKNNFIYSRVQNSIERLFWAGNQGIIKLSKK